QIIDEKNRDAVLEQASRVLSDVTVPPVEYRIRHKDGSIRWVKNTPVPRCDEKGLLVAYDGLISDITERKTAEEDLKEHSRELLLLTDASNSIIGITTTDILYKIICENAQRLFNLRMVWIGIIGEEDFNVKPAAYAGFEDNYLSDIKVTWDDSPTSKGPTGRSIKTMQQVLFNVDDADFELWKDAAKGKGYSSILGVPLIITGVKCIGALTSYSSDPNYFTPYRINLFRIFANQAAIAIENARLLEGLEKKIRGRTGELEKANTELKKMFNAIEQAAEIIVITDAMGTIQYVNPAFLAVSGYRREEALGKNPRILNSGKNPPGLFKDMWETILSGRIWKGTVINRKKTGELYYEEMIITPVINKERDITNFIAIKNDVTDRIKAEEEMKQKNAALKEAKQAAERANMAKSEFLVNMSHELRTPLNSIIGFSEIMELGIGGELNKEQKENIGYVTSSGKYLLSLINEILELSKVEAGKINLELATFSPSEMVNTFSKLLIDKVNMHRVEMNIDIESDVPDGLTADPKRLKQILYNLLSNAVKFTPEGGSVTVRVKNADKDHIEISVEDTGIGIKPDDIPKLFREFVQLESPYHKKYEGTGLGLALTKRLVE